MANYDLNTGSSPRSRSNRLDSRRLSDVRRAAPVPGRGFRRSAARRERRRSAVGRYAPLGIGAFEVCVTCLVLSLGFLAGCDRTDRDAVADSPEQASGPSEAVSTSKPQPDGGERRANRLSAETSPYLLLHAHNPVDWYPWGPEAFERAKQDGKPIFLSIGYSSCYWCHVMERLVFENEKIAAYMNEHFVNVKVDREERPDVDDIYMTALLVYFQAIGSPQGGGWPLSIFLTPEGKPIAGGTYFPPEDDHGRMGFPGVMSRVVDVWQNNRATVESNAQVLAQEVQRLSKPGLLLNKPKLERGLSVKAVQALLESYDAEHGGVDFNASQPNSPKFPVPAKLACLQYEVTRHGNEDAAEVLYHTLDRMARGGIHDHLGGGFHRYSTDRRWHVPHFEKMLYDQAQLAEVYTRAYRQTGNSNYANVAAGIFEFVLREMTGPDGAFYSALDAETDDVEGKRYVWSADEVHAVLGEDARLFGHVYGLDQPQVFEHGYVLHLPQPIERAADELQIPPAELEQRLSAMRENLLAARDARPALLKDDKVLTSWNGMMIGALAHGGRILGRSELTEAAQRAALFLLTRMRDEQGRLHRTYRAEQATLNAYLDDYAFLVDGLLALYEATGDEKWLNAAQRLADDQVRLFWDAEGKGFFFTAHHHEELLARVKNAHDAVLPSGNSVSVRNFVRLASLTGKSEYREYARETLQLFAAEIEMRPRAMMNMALALEEYLEQSDPPVTEAQPASQPASPHDDDSSQGVILQVTGESADAKDTKDEKITAQAYLSVDRLPAGRSCGVVVLIDVVPGWHVNANPAQPDFLIPTRLTLKSKHGTQLAEVTYPKGKELQMEGIDQPLLVYEGRVAIRGALSIPPTAGGQVDEIELVVRYQACNDLQCLAPAEVKLKGQVPVAAVGKPVKRINDKLFSDAKTP